MNYFVHNILGFLEKNYFFLILWILPDAFELVANVVNFVYHGKTLLCETRGPIR